MWEAVAEASDDRRHQLTCTRLVGKGRTIRALALEDYALLGDTHTSALVGRDGSVDWLCLPRFDSDACLAALLVGPEHGRWWLAPAGEYRTTGRRYRGDSLVLQTEFTTGDGMVRIIDCMPIAGERFELLRRVEGVSGRVLMRTELSLLVRFRPHRAMDPPRERSDGGGRRSEHRLYRRVGRDDRSWWNAGVAL